MNRSLKDRMITAILTASIIHVIEMISGGDFSILRIAWLALLWLALDYVLSLVVKKWKE